MTYTEKVFNELFDTLDLPEKEILRMIDDIIEIHLAYKLRDGPGKYWICHPCTMKKGWIDPGGISTCISGTCSWCKGKNQINTTLIPTCDYDIPGVRSALFD